MSGGKAGAKAPAATIPGMEKPDFGTRHGVLVDPAFLPPKLRDELVELACSGRLSNAEAERFVAACSEWAQADDAGGRIKPFAIERAQLLEAAKQAARFLDALRGLGVDARESIEVHTPPEWSEQWREHWPDGLPEAAWDMASALHDALVAATDYLPTGQNPEPAVQVGFGLAWKCVTTFKAQTGRLPPDDESGWFVDFMQRLGKHIGVTSGPRPVKRAIKEVRRAGLP